MSEIARPAQATTALGPIARQALATASEPDRVVATLLGEACRLLGLPVPGLLEKDAATLDPAVAAALAASLPPGDITDDVGTARGAWLAALYDALLELRGAATTARRPRMHGEHYTPVAIARELTEASLGSLLAAARTRDELLALRILEPAAGAGAFLAAVLRACAARYAALPGDTATATQAAQAVLEAGVIRGLERDPLAVCVAQRVLALVFEMPLNASQTWRTLAATVRVADALTWLDDAAERFDAVLTNPPYLFSRDVSPEVRAALALPSAGFALAQSGQWDLCWLFAEAALTRWLRPGGRLGLLLPEAVLARDESARLRRFVVERVCELEVWPLGVSFAHAQTGIVALTATATREQDAGDGYCTVHSGNDNNNGSTAARIPLAALRASTHARFVATPSVYASCAGNKAASAPRSLGDVVRIRRGDEVGKRSLQPVRAGATCPPGHVPVLSGASLSVPLAPPQPTHWMPAELAKKPAENFAPPTVVLAKTGKQVHAALERHGLRCLQSVYTLRLRAEAPAWLTLELLCALLVAEVTQTRWILPVTSSKRVFPQITQSLLTAIPLPPPPRASCAKSLRAALEQASAKPAAAKATVDTLVASWLAG